MKKIIRKWLAGLLAVLLLAGCSAGLADSVKTSSYAFIPGEILSGDGSAVLSELLRAIRLELTSQTMGNAARGRVTLISEEREAFTLQAESTEDGLFSFCCSLTGKVPICGTIISPADLIPMTSSSLAGI